MSSTEPPSRNQRGQSHETKSAREQLESKGLVEKVREVDPDEQARKERFGKFYNTDPIDNKSNRPPPPSPFDLCSRRQPSSDETDSFSEGVVGAIIPAPSYANPPDLSSNDFDDRDDEEDALPRSDDFWQGRNNADFPPDEPHQPQAMQEGRGGAKRKESDEQIEPQGLPVKKGAQPPLKGGQSAKKEEFTPFGPPGKPKVLEAKNGAPIEKKKLPSPFEQAAELKVSAKENGAEKIKGPKINRDKSKMSNEDDETQLLGSIPLSQKSDEKEGGGNGRGKEGRILQIESPSNQGLPAGFASQATAATMRASPFLNETTMSLFFQMVGTMMSMAGPQGVSQTEIVLNNPNFASSKFFGATIRIEKYATAPDSFNITLSGSTAAVTSFQDNMPSLLAAFQNGNFTFKVNRLDVEYGSEKPVFRRKARGDDQSDTGGEMGERRK